MRGLKRIKALAVVVLISVCATIAAADGISVKNAELDTSEEGVFLNADFDLELTPKLLDAVSHGVVLDFLLEFELWRPRSYWFDQTLTYYQEHRRLSYVPVTRMYRLSSGNRFETYPSLNDALRSLAQIRVVPSGEKLSLTKGTKYEASISLKLDTSQLSKPLQLETFSTRDWELSSPVHRFTVSP